MKKKLVQNQEVEGHLHKMHHGMQTISCRNGQRRDFAVEAALARNYASAIYATQEKGKRAK